MLGARVNIHLGLLSGCWRPIAMPMNVPHHIGFAASSGIPPSQGQLCVAWGGCRSLLAHHTALDVPGAAESGSLPCGTQPHTLPRGLCCFCAINEL